MYLLHSEHAPTAGTPYLSLTGESLVRVSSGLYRCPESNWCIYILDCLSAPDSLCGNRYLVVSLPHDSQWGNGHLLDSLLLDSQRDNRHLPDSVLLGSQWGNGHLLDYHWVVFGETGTFMTPVSPSS